MHEGCHGQFESGAQVVNKLRMMGYSGYAMPQPIELICEGCQTSFVMATFEARCGHCGMVYGVTPCHATDAASIRAAGVDY